MSSEESKKHKRLLVVDDEPELRDVLAEICKELTDFVTTASNGEDAWKLIQNGDVDAVLTDINMPKMSGLELLSKARQAGRELPFVMLTAYGDKDNVVQALRLGANDFIDKPFDYDKLLGSVEMALELGVALKDLEAKVEAICRDLGLPRERYEEVRQAQKVLWSLKSDYEKKWGKPHRH